LAKGTVFILYEAETAKWSQIIVNRFIFGHVVSSSLHSEVVLDFYVTEVKASFSDFSIFASKF
jgi:hypothetical protein